MTFFNLGRSVQLHFTIGRGSFSRGTAFFSFYSNANSNHGQQKRRNRSGIVFFILSKIAKTIFRYISINEIFCKFLKSIFDFYQVDSLALQNIAYFFGVGLFDLENVDVII